MFGFNLFTDGERRQGRLPPLELQSFAKFDGVPVPSGVDRYWAKIAEWQFQHLVTVEISNASGETCGIVRLTPQGRRAVR